MTFAAAGPVAKLLIGKALTTEKEFLGKLFDERGLYQEILGRITAEPFGNA